MNKNSTSAPQLSILCVDDEKSILRALERLFWQEAFTVLTAASGEEGLAILRSTENVGLILSDQRMPEMTGTVFLQAAAVLRPDIPRMILTGYSDATAAIAAINEGGAYRFLTKPWNEPELLQAVRDGLDRYRLLLENRRLTALVRQQNEELSEWNDNITKRKQAEEKLQEATQYIKQIISSAQEGVIVYDLNLRYRVWNSFMEELTGMTASEVLGRHPSELFPFLQASGVLERLERVLSGEAPAPVDFPYVVPKTGKSGWASDLSGPLWDTNGKIIGVITTVREITWRNQVKQDLLDKQQLLEKMNCSLEEMIEDLRISEDRFRTITSSAQDAIIMLDEGGNISFWNEAAERLFGYTKEEVSGHNLHTLLVPPPFREAHQRAFPHFQHTGQGSAVGKMVELAGLRRDGSEFPLELSLSSVHVKDAWHAIGIVRDITDSKELEQRIIKRNCALERANVELTAVNTALELKRCEAEEAQRELQLLNEKHRIIFDNANDGIIICNMQAQMLEVNPLAVERLGYTHTELMAMLVDQVDSPEEGSRVPERMARLREQGHLTFETTHLRKDGTSIPTEVSARLIQWDGDGQRRHGVRSGADGYSNAGYGWL